MAYEIISQDPEDKAVYVHNVLGSLAPLIEYERPQSDQELMDRVGKYFEWCAEMGTIPTIEKLALYTGTSYGTFKDWASGRSLGTGPKCQEICQRAKEICSVFEAQAALDNKINPVVYIYRSKAHYGFKDNPDVVLTVSSDQRSKEEILAEAEALKDI